MLVDGHGEDGQTSIVQSWQAVSENTLKHTQCFLRHLALGGGETERERELNEHLGEMEQEFEMGNGGSTWPPHSCKTSLFIYDYY